MFTLQIDCLEKCPFQQNGFCTKTDCKAENHVFRDYNLCPYVAVGSDVTQKSFKVSNIPLTGIKASV